MGWIRGGRTPEKVSSPLRLLRNLLFPASRVSGEAHRGLCVRLDFSFHRRGVSLKAVWRIVFCLPVPIISERGGFFFRGVRFAPLLMLLASIDGEARCAAGGRLFGFDRPLFWSAWFFPPSPSPLHICRRPCFSPNFSRLPAGLGSVTIAGTVISSASAQWRISIPIS